jgi:hypothetical protein
MTWLAAPDGSPGRPAVFSDAAIQFCLTIKVLFKLPLRQTTGMVASLMKLADLDWAVPDHTTLCRRQKTLAVQIPYRRADGPLNLLVDSTGIKFLGDGALSWFASKPLPGNKWQARKHGIQGRRQWRKVHLAMDTATSDIRAVEFTPSSDGDSPVLPELMDQIPDGEEIGTVTADGAYDPRRCHTATHCPAMHVYMHERDRPAGHRDHTDPQERAALEGRLSVGNRQKRNPPRHTELWQGVLDALDRIPCKKPEAKMRCLKAFGERIAARDPDRQTAEIQIRVALMNRFAALRTAEIVRVV